MVVVVDADAAGTDLSVYAFFHYFILLTPFFTLRAKCHVIRIRFL